MKVIEALALLAFAVGGVVIALTFITNGLAGIKRLFRRRAKAHGQWKMLEESEDESVVVRVIEPGTDRALLVGEAAFAHDDFDMQLEILRAEARQKLLTLNSERK